MTVPPAYIAFEGSQRIAAGTLLDVAMAARKRAARQSHEAILIFDHATSRRLDIDFSGSEKELRTRLAILSPADVIAAEDSPVQSGPRGPGRPKLGVVPREVTLLPRHWDWLNAQPGGASVALRKLVDDARKTRGKSDALRARQEAAYRLLTAIAGDWRNYEEANRALFAGDAERFFKLTDSWPADVRDHARLLAFPTSSPRA